MSQAPPSASGLVRVTVASGTRRVDLVLPGAVPVAELVPELARSVGLLDATTVYGGYRLVTADGRELATDAGLMIQGVEDGGSSRSPPASTTEPARLRRRRRGDDRRGRARPQAVVARRRPPYGALCAAGLLMALGAVALLIQRELAVAGAAAGLVALALVAGAIVLSRAPGRARGRGRGRLDGRPLRRRRGSDARLDDDFFGPPVAAAGGAAMVAGLVAWSGWARAARW